VGRPSFTQRVVGVDLGGTKILAGRLDRDGAVHDRCEVATPTSSEEELLAGIESAVAEVFTDEVSAIGCGIPSVLDRRTGRSLDSTNIPLAGLSLGDRLATSFGVPASVENDANAAALAEWKRGAGVGVDELLLLTLGTGVGGGVVLDGALFRGWAELGHSVVVADGPPCQGTCTGRGHLESVVSGNAADRAAVELWGPGATAEQLVERAEAGADDALTALASIGRLLGAGIGSLVNVFGVELVIVGGGFGSAAAEFLFAPALEVARREALPPARAGLRIVEAALGVDAGLIGAGLVGFAELDGER
jgi:glucokinase